MSSNSIQQDTTQPTGKNNTTSKPDTLGDLLAIYLKGIAMGAADIVPGVSGGTIALIAGIYHRLINAIGSVDLSIWHIWRQKGLVNGFIAVWRHLDATFIVCLLAGIATSFITLAGLIGKLLEEQPLYIWSLFFGLVVATVFILLKSITHWTWQRGVLFILGLVAAVGISQLPLMSGTPSLFYLFFSGAIAICAMILPGVSGSFILLLLGSYKVILDAVHHRDFVTILTVMAGMLVGILLFSKLLKWLLARYYQGTLAILTGFIAGSLVKIWPWKQDNTNLLPWHYPTGAEWLPTLGLMGIGAAMVLGLLWWGRHHTVSHLSS